MEYKDFDESFSLAGKTALVTGAGSGLGRATAMMFGRKGADLALVDINAAAANETSGLMASYGRKIVCLQCDVANEEDVEKMTADAVAALGRIDILINCAGVGFLDDAENLSMEIWDKTMAVNLRGAFMVAQKVGRRMIGQGGGKIVNFASQGALVALDNHSAYNASKAGMLGLTRTLAYEWARFNIQVNAVSPTVIVTELTDRTWVGETREKFLRSLPAGRFGHPNEVAAAALYLSSDASNLVTGANLVIDGGYTIQ
ncbi:MAG: D-threitol dehydrogenase [Planctomycetota bacterium]|nr:D-threitol dehydrogenase [Planctomycetota bacterium]